MQENLFKNYICKCEVYLQYQWHPDKKHHESIKHTPTILNIGIIPLYEEKQRITVRDCQRKRPHYLQVSKSKRKKVCQTKY